MAVPNMWRTQKQRYNLQGEVCPKCASAIFPPRKVCPQCGSLMDLSRRNRHHAATATGAAYSVAPAMAMIPAGDD